jgi:hypothetical protein
VENMGFFEKLKTAIKKIKSKLIVATVLVIVILLWGVAPFTVAIKVAWEETPVIDSETQEYVYGEDGQVKVNTEFNWETFLEALGQYLGNPFEAVGLCFSEYLSAYMYTCKWFIIFFGMFVFIGVIKALPKHEYENIENGSSDWSENGEQYQVLSKTKGIILAEKNYLPTDKRGNVNVLVVRRFWCW